MEVQLELWEKFESNLPVSTVSNHPDVSFKITALHCPVGNSSPWSRSLSERRFNELFKIYYIIIGNFDKLV